MTKFWRSNVIIFGQNARQIELVSSKDLLTKFLSLKSSRRAVDFTLNKNSAKKFTLNTSFTLILIFTLSAQITVVLGSVQQTSPVLGK